MAKLELGLTRRKERAHSTQEFRTVSFFGWFLGVLEFSITSICSTQTRKNDYILFPPVWFHKLDKLNKTHSSHSWMMKWTFHFGGLGEWIDKLILIYATLLRGFKSYFLRGEISCLKWCSPRHPPDHPSIGVHLHCHPNKRNITTTKKHSKLLIHTFAI